MKLYSGSARQLSVFSFCVVKVLAQQRCDVLADVLKRCLDDERLLLESYVNNDVTAFSYYY